MSNTQQSDTPRVNKVLLLPVDLRGANWELLELARQLERELAEAKGELEDKRLCKDGVWFCKQGEEMQRTIDDIRSARSASGLTDENLRVLARKHVNAYATGGEDGLTIEETILAALKDAMYWSAPSGAGAAELSPEHKRMWANDRRYRFLRDFLDPEDYYSKWPRWTVACESGGMGSVYRGDELDRKVDEAIAATEEGKT